MFEHTGEQLEDIIATASVETANKFAENDPLLKVALIAFSGALSARIFAHLEGRAPLDTEELEKAAKARMKWEEGFTA